MMPCGGYLEYIGVAHFVGADGGWGNRVHCLEKHTHTNNHDGPLMG